MLPLLFFRLSEWLAETQGLYGLTNSQIVASMTNSGFNYAEAFQKLGVDPGSIKFEGRDDGDTESDEAHLEELQFVDINEIIKKGQLFLPNRSSCAAQTLILCASIDFVTCLQQYPILKQVHDRVMNKCNTLWQAAGKVKNEKTFQNILGELTDNFPFQVTCSLNIVYKGLPIKYAMLRRKGQGVEESVTPSCFYVMNDSNLSP